MNYVLDDVRDAALTQIGQLGILSEEQQADLERVFEYTDPFAGLQSEYLQTKYYRENFNLVVKIHYHACCMKGTNINILCIFTWTGASNNRTWMLHRAYLYWPQKTTTGS